MDQRLIGVLESLLLNVEVLSDEVRRLSRCEQFTGQSLEVIHRIRESYMDTMKYLRLAERQLRLGQERQAAPSADILPLPLHEGDDCAWPEIPNH